jgi:HK97 family phage prohead protease
MISKATVEQRRDYSNRAAKDLAKKLKLESGFKKDLKSFFESMADKLKSTYEQVGQVPPANLFEVDLRKILDKNYKIISKNFDSLLRMNTKAFDAIEYKAMDDDIRATVNGYISRHSIDQANIITATNQEDMAVSVAKVKQNAMDKGVILSNKEIAAQAYLVFKNKAFNRIDTIATTETQNIAESSKYIEAGFIEQNILNGLYKINRRNKDIGSIKPLNVIEKTWITILDERTRLSHVLADEQKQPTNLPFIVEGQKLMTPGDASLGASLDNLINCRCSCIYDVDQVSLNAIEKMPTYSTSTELIRDVDLEQNRIVDNLRKGIPNPPNPPTIIIENSGRQYAYVQGNIASANEVTPYGWAFDKDTFNYSVLDKLNEQGLRYTELYYEGKEIGYSNLVRLSVTKDNIYTGAYIDLSNPLGREAFEKIRKGEIKGFSNSFYDFWSDPKNIKKTLSLEEAKALGYDLSGLEPGITQITVVKKVDFRSLRLLNTTDPEKLLFRSSTLDPIDINKPLPKDVRALYTEKFVYPENIKNGENITIVEDVNGKKLGFVRGYATIFNEVNTHRYLLQKEAIENTLKDRLERGYFSIDMLYNHDKSKNIGRFPIRNMRVDDHGLYVEGFVDLDTELGRQVFNDAKGGKLPAFSTGYQSIETQYIQDVIFDKKIDLFEISIVRQGANPKALMMPVIGEQGAIRRAVGDDVAKALTPPIIKNRPVELSEIREFSTQLEADRFFDNLKSIYGIDYGKVSIDDLAAIKTQKELDKFLLNVREKRGIDFYTDLSASPVEISKEESDKIIDEYFKGENRFDKLPVELQQTIIDKMPPETRAAWQAEGSSTALFNDARFDEVFEEVDKLIAQGQIDKTTGIANALNSINKPDVSNISGTPTPSSSKVPKIELSTISKLETQKDVDNFFLDKVFNDGTDYGKIDVDDLRNITTQKELDKFLEEIRKQRGSSFYVNLNGETPSNRFDTLTPRQQQTLVDTMPAEIRTTWEATGRDATFFNDPQFNGVFKNLLNPPPPIKDITQSTIVKNLIEDKPNVENPPTIIIDNEGKQFAYIQGVAAKAGDVSPYGLVYEKEVFLNPKVFSDLKSKQSYAPLFYKEQLIGQMPIEKVSSVYDTLYGRAYIDLSNPLGREAFEKIRKGEIKGFDMPFKAPEINQRDISRVLTLEEAAAEGYDLSNLNPNVDKILVIKRADFVGLNLQDASDVRIFPKNEFDPIKINKTLPPGLTSLETPKFEVPTNIKNGKNITIVEDVDGKKHGFVRGYATVFNNVDTYRAIIEKEDTIRTINDLKQNTKTLQMLHMHDPAKQVGYFPIRNMRIDDHGLYVEGFVDLDTELGRQVFNDAKGGKLPAFSIGFNYDPLEATYIQDVGVYKKYNLFEISLVNYPGNTRALMMPVIGEQASIARSTGSDIFKASIPTNDKIELSLVRTWNNQQDVDYYFETIALDKGINYGRINIADLRKIKTQEELDNFLLNIREVTGLGFYTDLAEKISKEGIEKTRGVRFSNLSPKQQQQFIESLPTSVREFYESSSLSPDEFWSSEVFDSLFEAFKNIAKKKSFDLESKEEYEYN